jgi:hypothetical protein
MPAQGIVVFYDHKCSHECDEDCEVDQGQECDICECNMSLELDEMTEAVRDHCNKYNIDIKRGDLVRISTKKNTYEKYDDAYRNQDLYIVCDDSCTLMELDYDVDSYGALPSEFVCYEEYDYFTRDHWKYTDEKGNTEYLFQHAQVLHLAISDEALENIKQYDLAIYTYWNDCRGARHYYIEHGRTVQLQSFESMIKKACKKGYLTFIDVDDDRYLHDVIISQNDTIFHYGLTD